jgi:hypothetical protein
MKIDGGTCTVNADCLNNACCAGICRNLANDVNNCGVCGRACVNPHGATACIGGTCSPTCTNGFASCDGDVVNGCESSLNANKNSSGSATSLGSVAGDSGSDTRTSSDWGAKWYRVRVNEVSSSAIYLSAGVLLSGLATNDYDVYVYAYLYDSGLDACVWDVYWSSTTRSAGTNESVVPAWPDQQGFFGCDDSKDLWIYVDFVSGTSCQAYTLTVVGNSDAGFDPGSNFDCACEGL